MIKKSQKAKVKWTASNKKGYIAKGYVFTKFGDVFSVSAEDLAKTSRINIIVVCDICEKEEYTTTAHNANKSKRHACEKCKPIKDRIKAHCENCQKEMYVTKTRIKESISGQVFCSNSCFGKYRDKKILKNCEICQTEYLVKRAIAKNSVSCSVECQNKWQSVNLVGENANNYKGEIRDKTCEQCRAIFTCSTPSQYETQKFCSKKCRQNHWIENTLTSPEFSQRRREGNILYRKTCSNELETKPERLIREVLETHGLVKDRDFFQEQGFFRKYFADFFLPKNKLVIEVQGDYWHGNPNVYGVGKIPLNQQQLDRIKKDKEKKRDFLKSGFKYIEIWEKDIYENPTKALQDSLLKTYPRNDYTLDFLTFLDEEEDIV